MTAIVMVGNNDSQTPSPIPPIPVRRGYLHKVLFKDAVCVEPGTLLVIYSEVHVTPTVPRPMVLEFFLPILLNNYKYI